MQARSEWSSHMFAVRIRSVDGREFFERTFGEGMYVRARVRKGQA